MSWDEAEEIAQNSRKQFVPPKELLEDEGLVSKRAPKKTGNLRKIVRKVMAWNASTSQMAKQPPETNSEEKEGLASDEKSLKAAPDESEDNLCRADWLRARDSLENLLLNRSGESTQMELVQASRSEPAPFGKSKRREGEGHKHASAHSISKVLAWDPWDKLGRKSKRDNKRRKEKKTERPAEAVAKKEELDQTGGDEGQSDDEETYEYRPYRRAKNVKSVDFTNEVRVVHFRADQVVGESKEPLKRELEQQVRNKEMRRGHCPALMAARPQPPWRTDDYVLPYRNNGRK